MKINRKSKGHNIVDFPCDYVVVDLETTGLDCSTDYIIEIGALKIIQNEIVEQFSTLVKPTLTESGEIFYISDYVTQLTGITSEMLANAPHFSEVAEAFKQFIGDFVLIGHSINFDVNFLYDNYMKEFQIPIENDFIDTHSISKKALPSLERRRLIDVAEYYSIRTQGSHRALRDCEMTNSCFQSLKETILTQYGSVESFAPIAKKRKKKIHISDIIPSHTDFNPSHPFYRKLCVLAGSFEQYTHREAMQAITDVGGMCGHRVNENTAYLIISNKGESHNKNLTAAEQLQSQGYNIFIINEDEFSYILHQTEF